MTHTSDEVIILERLPPPLRSDESSRRSQRDRATSVPFSFPLERSLVGSTNGTSPRTDVLSLASRGDDELERSLERSCGSPLERARGFPRKDDPSEEDDTDSVEGMDHYFPPSARPPSRTSLASRLTSAKRSEASAILEEERRLLRLELMDYKARVKQLYMLQHFHVIVEDSEEEASPTTVLWKVLAIQFVPLAIILVWISIPLARPREGFADNWTYVWLVTPFWAIIIAVAQTVWYRRLFHRNVMWQIPFVFLVMAVVSAYAVIAAPWGFDVFPVPFAPTTVGIGSWMATGVVWLLVSLPLRKEMPQFWQKFVLTQVAIALPPTLFVGITVFSTLFKTTEGDSQALIALLYPIFIACFVKVSEVVVHYLVPEAVTQFAFLGHLVGDIFGMLLFPNFSSLSTFQSLLVMDLLVLVVPYYFFMSKPYDDLRRGGRQCLSRVLPMSLVDFILSDPLYDISDVKDDDINSVHNFGISDEGSTFQRLEAIEMHVRNPRHPVANYFDAKTRHWRYVTIMFFYGLWSEVICIFAFVVFIFVLRFGNNRDYYSIASGITDENFRLILMYTAIKLAAVMIAAAGTRWFQAKAKGFDLWTIGGQAVQRQFLLHFVNVLFALIFPFLVFMEHMRAESFVDLI